MKYYIESHARLNKQPWNRHKMERLTLPDTIIGDDTIVCSGATIYAGTEIGHHCFIGDGASIRENCVIGNYTLIGRNVTIENDTKIGAHVMIQTAAHITGNAVILDHVSIGPEVCMTNAKYMRDDRCTEFKGPMIGAYAQIGGNATILPGVYIAPSVVIGAGTVVLRDITEVKTTWVGNPARKLN